MDFITLNEDNLKSEHICCAISDKKGENCVGSKKAWLRERFKDGLKFVKADIRGKVFIEYIPAEKAWCPIEAPGYLFIDCFWVSGQYKGQGLANQLLEIAINDARDNGKAGLVVLSSQKKSPFLSDPKYLKYKGFQIADTAIPSYELLYLPLDRSALIPRFKDCAKLGEIPDKGMVLYYSNQCPHTDKYAPMLSGLAAQRGRSVKLVKFETAEQAQKAPAPFTAYSLFFDGKLVTNEILSEKKFLQFMDER